MLVPFGNRVVDSTGKSVGTVSRVILHPQSREVAGLVVHQGVLNRREVVVPLTKVTGAGDQVTLAVPGAELEGFDLFHSAALQPMPDQWDMPIGFDQRDFFLVGTDAWADAVLPFEPTSAARREPRATRGTRARSPSLKSRTSRPACPCTTRMASGSGTWRRWSSTRPRGESSASPSGADSCSSTRPASLRAWSSPSRTASCSARAPRPFAGWDVPHPDRPVANLVAAVNSARCAAARDRAPPRPSSRQDGPGLVELVAEAP